MGTKTHLTRQEELVSEVGVQVRETDPVLPVATQIWLNTQQNRLKARVGGVVRVYDENFTTLSLPVPVSNALDFNESYNYYEEITLAKTYSIENLLDGVVGRLVLENNQVAVNRILTITFPSSAQLSDGAYWTIPSASNVRNYHVWYDFNGTGNAEPVVPNSTPIAIDMTNGVAEVSTITVKTPLSPVLGRHFKISNGNNEEYYVWWNVDGFGGDPFPGNSNGIQVAITTATSAANIAILTATAINNRNVGFSAVPSSATITITNTMVGVADDINSTDIDIVVSTAVLVQGESPDTADEIAQFTADALVATGDFTASRAGNIVTLTYADAGVASLPNNVSIPAGFAYVVTQAGSGPIEINFALSIGFDDPDVAKVAPAQSVRVYEFVRILNNVIGSYKDIPTV
jgi:hypothetical protein